MTQNGGACFVSDLFEGDIDDVEIFKESGLVKHLKPFDLVLAGSGFTVWELLKSLQVELKIPSFLKGRKSLRGTGNTPYSKGQDSCGMF